MSIGCSREDGGRSESGDCTGTGAVQGDEVAQECMCQCAKGEGVEVGMVQGCGA